MRKLLALSIALSILFSDLISQTKYWVKFNNKNGTPYSIATPTAFLTQRSIQRRIDYGIPLNQSDLPVTPAYISQVDAVTGVSIIYASKWMNGVVIAVSNTTALNTIAGFSFVTSTSIAGRYKVNLPVKVEEPVTYQSGRSTAVPNYFGRSYWQNKQLGIDCIHSQGKRGQGIVIAVLDAGFYAVDVNPTFDSLRTRGGILGTRDFVTGGTSVYEDNNHGAAVLSIMAALVPSLIVGTAPMADYWLLRTEDVSSEKIIEEYNWIRGAEFADSVGADILTTSLGYTTFDIGSQNHSYSQLNGRTAPMSIAANMAARKGMFVANAAGNEGGGPWNYIGVPADADSVCSVGAVDSNVIVAAFSSRGPTFDGRRKPDLSARGVLTWVSWMANGACEAGNGTSYATPALAGAVACFWQAHRNFNNIKVLDTLRKTASHALNPNNDLGWGVPTMCCIPVGLNENTLATLGALKVVPNPFSSTLSLTLSRSRGAKTNLFIYDALGRLVYSMKEINAEQVEVNLSDLAPGIYSVHAVSEEHSEFAKVIKQ